MHHSSLYLKVYNSNNNKKVSSEQLWLQLPHSFPLAKFFKPIV